MSPPEVWGPPVWTLFHALAENINEDYYKIIAAKLFGFFQRICAYLPCPECAKDAMRVMGSVTPQNIQTKQGLIYTMYVFHNHVNRKKNKPPFDFSHLAKYRGMNLIVVFNKFASVYNTTGNMNLIAESFQRKMILSDFRKWFVQNIRGFIKTTPPLLTNNTVTETEDNK
jgi:hypothetical protein